MVPNDQLAPTSSGAPRRFLSDADELLAQFQRIEQVWKRAEEILAATHVPVDVRVKVDSDEGDYAQTFLSYERVKGARRICFVREDYNPNQDSTHADCRPIVEQPVNLRVEMFNEFGRLYEEATAVAKSYIPKLEEAINRFEISLVVLTL